MLETNIRTKRNISVLDVHRAKLDLRNKIKFERRMINRLTPLLTRIVKDAKRQLSNGVKEFDVKKWSKGFAKILSEHYQNVSVLFSRNLENQLDVKIDAKDRLYIDSQLALYFAIQVEETSQQLVTASIKNAEFAIQVAEAQQQAQIETGEDVSHNEFLVIFANVFRKRLNGRKKTISLTETQKAAEASKFVEYEVWNTGRTRINTPSITTPVKGFKDWYAILDDVTRPTHVVADRTQRDIPVNQPYKVGQGFMMFPGDRSLGAKAKEIINCRCVSIYKTSK